ncbi:endo-1,31,4-beta-d-glucanase [Nicotiana attenuata]|uniref:Endo-1,31,4-beta-d-glucanase n=1 Tax=Nicotiana attenuata TaxID=49451 RepID=A0A1J6IIH6_NICAT|nr:endo-1,31,4-beta-d-glucanase [Nicotiana attenuata]
MSGAECCENPPKLRSGSSGGHVQQLGGFSCYVSGPPHSTLALLLVSDVFANDVRPLELWIKDHGPEQGFEDAKPVIEALKSKGITKIGAVGFCWGAKVVVEIAKYAYIQAAVLLHPSFVAVDDMHGMILLLDLLYFLLILYNELITLGMFRHNFHIGLDASSDIRYKSMKSLSSISHF